MQELQRLQEEQTGKKRAEKLEWMYTTPAAGSSQNAGELEDYLLGKKRVDKILTADDNAKVSFVAHNGRYATIPNKLPRHSSVLHTRTSSLFKMPTLLAI